MKRAFLAFVFALLAGCAATPAPPVDVPTLAQLPTATDTLTPTLTPPDAPAAEAAVAPSETPSLTPTLSETPTLTPTIALTPTLTYTPSATITDTVTPTPTATITATPAELLAVEGLVALALQATVLPPAAPGLVAPPAMSMGTMLPPANVNCAPPPGGFATAYNDGALAGTLGCPLPAAPVQVNSASQLFERGSMIYAQETPARIYVLYNDGTFRRYDDTWVGGVDPESGGETPPAGLLEPVRGFGKVWRTNPDVRAGLGWAFTPEAGALAWIQTFERGRMIALPQRNEIIALTDDAGGAGGRWRSFVGGY